MEEYLNLDDLDDMDELDDLDVSRWTCVQWYQAFFLFFLSSPVFCLFCICSYFLKFVILHL